MGWLRHSRIVLMLGVFLGILLLAACPLGGPPLDPGEPTTDQTDTGDDTGDDAANNNDTGDPGNPGDTDPDDTDPGATAAPSFDPAPGTYPADTVVTIAHVRADAVVHVTTDGTPATTDAPVYTDPIPVGGDGTTVTIRAVAREPDRTPSQEVVGTFTINYPDAAAPTISPSSGEFLGEAEITMATSTPGATVFYTTDDIAPTTTSSAYQEPLVITETTTIRAVAAADGFGLSAEASATIAVTPALLVRAQGADDPNPGAPIIDDRPGSLRDVIANAPSGSRIAFAEDFYDDGDGTTPLDAIGILKSDGTGVYVDGIFIDKDITIDGTGRTVELDAFGLGRHFTVLDGATLTLANVVLQNGDPVLDGGAIEVRSGGSLILTDVTIRESTAYESNGAHYAGGAIFAQGATVEITGGRFENNMAARGGAVNVSDTVLTIQGSEFVNNNGNLFAGGAIRLVGTQSVGTFEDVHFEANYVAQWGGAIAVVGGAVASIRGSTFLSNQAFSTANNNDSGGGAIYVGGGADPGTVTVATSRFIRNETQNFADSRSAGGGAILSDGRLVHVAASEFYGNGSDGDGAAITVDQGGEGEFTVSSSVFVGNYVSPRPGSPGLFDGIGALSLNAASNAVVLSSFAGNTGSDLAENVWFANSTVTANAVRNSAFDTIGMNLERIGTLSHSIAPESFAHPDDALNGLLRIGNVTDDPGFTAAPADGGDGYGQENDDYGDLRLQADSPAIDAGDNGSVPADLADLDDDGDETEDEPWDVTGGARVVGDAVDMGAYEY